MSSSLARVVMEVAAASFAPHRRGWKLAIENEFVVAKEAGEELSFALGCLATAWRELPSHLDGRLTLARYTFALGLILPAAALLLIGVLAGYPYVDPAFADAIGSFASLETIVPRLNASNACAVPVLGLVLLLRTSGDILVAWFVAERNWACAAAALRFCAAATITLALFAGLVVLEETCLVLPTVIFAIELLAVGLLQRWHDDAGDGAPTDWAL
jgi:hypothetical protein